MKTAVQHAVLLDDAGFSLGCPDDRGSLQLRQPFEDLQTPRNTIFVHPCFTAHDRGSDDSSLGKLRAIDIACTRAGLRLAGTAVAAVRLGVRFDWIALCLNPRTLMPRGHVEWIEVDTIDERALDVITLVGIRAELHVDVGIEAPAEATRLSRVVGPFEQLAAEADAIFDSGFEAIWLVMSRLADSRVVTWDEVAAHLRASIEWIGPPSAGDHG